MGAQNTEVAALQAALAQQQFSGGPLSEAEANATFETLAANRAIIFGTSLEAQNLQGPDSLDYTTATIAQSSRGWFHWANAFLGQRFKLVRNAGVGGNTYAQMRTRMATDVLAYTFDWLLLGGPVNDLGNRPIADIITDATWILDQVKDKRVIMLTCAPSSSYTVAAHKQAVSEVNEFIRALPLSRPNVIVVDAWKVLADPATGYPATGMAVDTVHFSEAAAIRVGREVATVAAPFVKPRPHRLSSAVDTKSIIPNPHFGSNGSGWTPWGAGAPAISYVAAEDRFANKAVVTLSAIADNNENGIQRVEPIAGGLYAVGDVIQLSFRVKWSSLVPRAVAAPCYPYARISARLVDSSFTNIEAQTLRTASADYQIPNGLPTSGEVVMVTSRMTIPANCNNLYIGIGWRGATSVTFEISDVACVKGA